MDWIIKIVEVIAAVAPGVIAAWTGSESDADALDRLRKLTDGLPVRGGSSGTWERDLAERAKRIRGEQ